MELIRKLTKTRRRVERLEDKTTVKKQTNMYGSFFWTGFVAKTIGEEVYDLRRDVDLLLDYLKVQPETTYEETKLVKIKKKK